MSIITNVSSQVSPLQTDSELRKAEVLTSLHLLGADEYDLLLPETHYLPHLLRSGEVVFGVVYGRYKRTTEMQSSRGLVVITDRRIVIVNKKPLYQQTDDIKFNVVSGVDYIQAGLAATITLHTRMGDINIRTFNRRCGRQFLEAVQDMLYHYQKGHLYDYDP